MVPASPVAHWQSDLSDADVGALVLDAFAEEDWQAVECPFENEGGTAFAIILRACKYYTRRGERKADVQVDASGAFESKCYNEWLQTRGGALQYPEEAFRKTITSHCCKTDGRKPFPAPVEAGILRELRKQRIWPCFEGLQLVSGKPVSIGSLGFRSVGFHEQAALEAAETARADATSSNSSNSVSLASSSKGKRAAPPTAAGDDAAPAPSDRRERVRANLAEWATNLPLLLMTLNKLGARPREFERADDSDNDFDDETVLRVLHRDVVPWTFRAAGVATLTRFFRPHHFLGLAHAQLFDEDALSLPLAVDDARLSLDFMFEDGLALLPDARTGRGLVCLSTFMWLEACDDACAIMHGSPVGRSTQEHAHAAVNGAVLAHSHPRLMQTGTLVYQYWAKAIPGDPIVLRVRFHITGDAMDKVELTLQDVSHLYPELFALPPLDDVVQKYAHQEVSDGQRQRSIEFGAATMRVINGSDS